MGKISEVLYGDVNPIIYDNKQAAEYYFYNNTMTLNEKFQSMYEEYERRHIKMRSRSIKTLMDLNQVNNVCINNSIFGTSVLKGHLVIVCELYKK